MVAWLLWATPVWLSRSRSGVGGRDWVSSMTRPSLSLDLFISLQRERKKKSGVLLVYDFLVLSLRVNFSLVGKQSLLSVIAELKLFPLCFLIKVLSTYDLHCSVLKLLFL